MLGAEVRTERVALAVGRRFFDLRTKARLLTTQAVLRTADLRLIPLVESRAFRDEPEEVAWAVLSLVYDQPDSDRLTEALHRIEHAAHDHDHDDDHDHDHDHDHGPQLDVLLQCEVCNETLRYRFERAFVDAEAKDELGDPAFVGPMICKACGTPDRLQATQETASILTQHMLAYLQAAQRGVPLDGAPLVSPAKMNVGGKTMGLAAALRALNAEVAERPESIRTRLHRARTRMILRRPGVDEDLDAVFAADPESVEAEALKATEAMRNRAYDEAAQRAIRALRRLKTPPEPRLYDVNEADELVESLEGYLLELSELGAAIPDDVDLRRARRLREHQLAELRAAHAAEEAQANDELEAPGTEASPEQEEAFKTAGRNDPCPCGSGKKFKRCHGR